MRNGKRTKGRRAIASWWHRHGGLFDEDGEMRDDLLSAFVELYHRAYCAGWDAGRRRNGKTLSKG